MKFISNEIKPKTKTDIETNIETENNAEAVAVDEVKSLQNRIIAND